MSDAIRSGILSAESYPSEMCWESASSQVEPEQYRAPIPILAGSSSEAALKVAGPHPANPETANLETANLETANLEIPNLETANPEIANPEIAALRAHNLSLTAQLQSSNQALDALAYSISHDLRAPLRHVSGFTTLLSKSRDSTLAANDRGLLDLIVSSALLMNQMIDGILQYSRIGSCALISADVDLRHIFDLAILSLLPKTEDRLVTWTLGPLPRVRGDSALLQQVATHLLDNALKFSTANQDVQIEIGCELGPKQETAVFVRDHGIGFDFKDAERIFEIFQRLHTAAECPGIGLGLALVRRIIHRHGGSTWARAEEHHGATFYFSLPSP